MDKDFSIGSIKLYIYIYEKMSTKFEWVVYYRKKEQWIIAVNSSLIMIIQNTLFIYNIIYIFIYIYYYYKLSLEYKWIFLPSKGFLGTWK